MAASVLAMLMGGGVADAKPKKPTNAGEAKKGKDEGERKKGPGDKGTNEGAQGRQNATEDAAKQGEHPSYDRRP
jgi:hypothetical protein